MTRFNKLFLVFVGGVVTGAVLGVLFAPDTGKNTRDKLSYQLDKYWKQLSEIVEMWGDKKQQQAGQLSENQIQEYKKAEELLKEVETLLDELKGKSV